jgi:Icc-related predicted phosphoesterase
MRIAAVGDLHAGGQERGEISGPLQGVEQQADLLLFAGDLTTYGDPEQARVFASEVERVGIPMVAVLGNHDYHSGKEGEIRSILEGSGVTVLEQGTRELNVGDRSIGIAGGKGFGGGFAGACATEFGEEEMKAFVRVTDRLAAESEQLLQSLRTDVRILLMHYSPVRDTLVGEPPEIYPFLGSYLFAEAADRAGADLILHGHAHRGSEYGVTPGGIPVRNVAKPVLRRAYAVFRFDEPVPAGAHEERGDETLSASAGALDRLA